MTHSLSRLFRWTPGRTCYDEPANRANGSPRQMMAASEDLALTLTDRCTTSAPIFDWEGRLAKMRKGAGE